MAEASELLKSLTGVGQAGRALFLSALKRQK